VSARPSRLIALAINEVDDVDINEILFRRTAGL
jgi:hypothetical protein